MSRPATDRDHLGARFKVTISTANVAAFMTDETHPAFAEGTVWVDGYTGPEGAAIVGGRFNLFTRTDNFYRRKMLYSLPFHDLAGRQYALQGYKEVWDHGRFDVWPSTTTLYTKLVDEDDPELPTVATGVLRLNLPMFAQQLTTVRVTGTHGPLSQLKCLAGFGQLFTSTLFDVFVRSKFDT
jgi:cholesterol oxidase